MSKERLTDNNKELIKCVGYTCEEVCHQHPCTCTDCPIEQGIIKLAEYEDLEEQGLLLRLPCKVGDTVYRIVPNTYRHIQPMIIQSFCLCGEGLIFKNNFGLFWSCEEFGKTVFLTQSEAEKKLRELEGGK